MVLIKNYILILRNENSFRMSRRYMAQRMTKLFPTVSSCKNVYIDKCFMILRNTIQVQVQIHRHRDNYNFKAITKSPLDVKRASRIIIAESLLNQVSCIEINCSFPSINVISIYNNNTGQSWLLCNVHMLWNYLKQTCFRVNSFIKHCTCFSHILSQPVAGFLTTQLIFILCVTDKCH